MDAINKAFEIFELFLHSEDELSINDVSVETKISYPTAHRITSTLVQRGYLIQPQKRGKYSVHPAKLSEFITILRKKLNLRVVAAPYLRELGDVVNETVLLAVRRGQVAINIDVVNRGLLNVTPDSSTLGLYYTGAGKLFLAHLSDTEFLSYTESMVMLPRTIHTITDKEALLREMYRIKNDGVAYEDEENELGLRSVAAPVKDWEGRVIAVVSILGPTNRIDRVRMLELASVVKDYAARISEEMGAQELQNQAAAV